ncbi:Uma2 family endonuclease [Deferrisoma camini]|uniref:Uma2 family endonuclease n=1 Tax=Deferrisoma camini TaxID=1035120 RepID=UPI00046CA530|nr:Uma2 family endonuclease [Deferrisoma camini]
MTPEPARRLFTVDEFHRMAEAGILGEDDRVELIEGELIEMTPIGSRHAACVKRILHTLAPHSGNPWLLSVQDPIALDPRTELQPDIALLKPRPDYYASAHPRPRDVVLIIEVADTSAAADREVKLPLYAKAGIPEVWLVDLPGGVIEVYRDPGETAYRTAQTLHPGDPTLPIPGTSLRLAPEQVLCA